MLIYLLHLVGETLDLIKMSIIYRNNNHFSILECFRFHGFRIFSIMDLEKYNKSTDVGTYLTDQMIAMAKEQNFDWPNTETRFKETFDHIKNSLGNNAFRRYSGGHFKGGFLLTPFEVIACGLGYNHPDFPTQEDTIQRVKYLYENEIYRQYSGSGVRANTRLPHLLPLGRELFKK